MLGIRQGTRPHLSFNGLSATDRQEPTMDVKNSRVYYGSMRGGHSGPYCNPLVKDECGFTRNTDSSSHLMMVMLEIKIWNTTSVMSPKPSTQGPPPERFP